MKILHISNFVQKHNGRLFWNHAFKITNGFIRNGHSVYLFSDRDISRLNLSNKLFNENKTQVNLLETFVNYDPDIVVIGHADRIFNNTLHEMKAKKKSLKIIEWNIDNYLLDNTENKLKERSEVVDGFFITNGDEVISSAAINKTFIAFIPTSIVDIISESLMQPFITNPDHPFSEAILARLSPISAHFVEPFPSITITSPLTFSFTSFLT